MPTETPVPVANALDAEALPLSDYRALREGRAVAVRETTNDKTDAPQAAAPEAETAPDSEPGDDTEEPQEQKPDAKPKRRKDPNIRFSELTGKIRELEGRLAAAPVAAGASPVEAPKPEAKTDAQASDVEPKAEDYADWNAYQRDLIRYELKQERKVETAKQSQQVEQARAEELRAAKAMRWKAQVEAGQAKYADFDTVARNPKLPITAVMAEALADTDAGPDILHHLGSHPEVAAQIAKLSPVAQVREIGKLEASLAAEEVDDTEDPVEPLVLKPVSQAPKPARSLGGRSSTPNPASPRNLEGMTQEAYRALRESGKLR